MADPGFGKGDFMRMCTVATTSHFDADAIKVAKLLSLFANYTSSKGSSMETVETPLDPPLAR